LPLSSLTAEDQRGRRELLNDDGSLPEKGLRVVVEEAKRVGEVEREISLSEIADLSTLKEALRELGLAAR
jgi:hypothetical protein